MGSYDLLVYIGVFLVVLIVVRGIWLITNVVRNLNKRGR
jgi:cytochrome b561